jgi:transposase-like protein
MAAKGGAGAEEDGEREGMAKLCDMHDSTPKSRAQKKRSRGWGRRLMRYCASEKFEIIELVEQSSLSVPRTLAPIGIPRSTFYDWYSRYQEGGIEDL